MNYLITLLLNPPKTRILPKTLKSNIYAFYIWLQVTILNYHGNYMINNMLIMKGVLTKMAS